MKGRADTFSVGEKVLIQNVQSKLWDIEAIITGVRVSGDGTIAHLKIVYLKRHESQIKKKERREANLRLRIKKEMGIQKDAEKGSTIASGSLDTDIS